MTAQRSLSRREFLRVSGLTTMGVTLAACTATPALPPSPTVEADVANPDEALARLLEGNRRYAAAMSTDLNESEACRIAVAKGQNQNASRSQAHFVIC